MGCSANHTTRHNRRAKALTMGTEILAALGEGGRWEDYHLGPGSSPGAEIRVWGRDTLGRTFRVVWWPGQRGWTTPDGREPSHHGSPEAFLAFLRMAVTRTFPKPDPAHARARRERKAAQAPRPAVTPRRLPPLTRPARPPEDDFDVIEDF